jgi:hypothetical protein
MRTNDETITVKENKKREPDCCGHAKSKIESVWIFSKKNKNNQILFFFVPHPKKKNMFFHQNTSVHPVVPGGGKAGKEDKTR